VTRDDDDDDDNNNNNNNNNKLEADEVQNKEIGIFRLTRIQKVPESNFKKVGFHWPFHSYQT
jgi:hypothetical protein